MKLRRIILLKHACLALLLAVGMGLLIRFVMLRSYAELEQRDCREDVERSQNALNAELREVDLAAQDYASWDSTYEFAKQPTPDYERINFSDVTLQNLRMRMVAIVASRRILLFQGDQPKNPSQLPPKDEALLLRIEAQANSFGDSTGLSGIVSFSYGPALVAARHIRRASGRGPSAGILVMARRLDKDLWRNLSVQVALPLELREFKDAEQYWPGLMTEIRTSQGSTVRIIDSETVVGLSLLNNLWDSPITC